MSLTIVLLDHYDIYNIQNTMYNIQYTIYLPSIEIYSRNYWRNSHLSITNWCMKRFWHSVMHSFLYCISLFKCSSFIFVPSTYSIAHRIPKKLNFFFFQLDVEVQSSFYFSQLSYVFGLISIEISTWNLWNVFVLLHNTFGVIFICVNMRHVEPQVICFFFQVWICTMSAALSWIFLIWFMVLCLPFCSSCFTYLKNSQAHQMSKQI